MDFASLMSAQIAKSKTPAVAPSPTTAEAAAAQKPTSKYLRRADLEAQRQAAYAAEQKALEEARIARLNKKRKFEEEEAEKDRAREEKRKRLAEESRRVREAEEEEEERKRRKRLGLPELVKPAETEASAEAAEDDIPDAELVAKLREMGEPARVFGESHAGRRRRFRRLAGLDDNGKPRAVVTSGPIPTTLEPVPEADMKVPEKPPADPEGLSFLHRQLASYFTMVLTEWKVSLALRDEAVKASSTGKAALNAMVQARESMVPLFRKLEKGEVEDGILGPIVEIVRCCQERRYVDANDAYLRLSIGKAAWPIGVTMVGIHERSAREKLHASDKNAAHIMSDETTRKFLQSIKRCLSFSQTRWPPASPLQLMG